MEWKCEKCGMEGNDGKFCSNCGNKLEVETLEKQEQIKIVDEIETHKNSASSKKIISIVIVIILLIIVAFGIKAFMGGDDANNETEDATNTTVESTSTNDVADQENIEDTVGSVMDSIAETVSANTAKGVLNIDYDFVNGDYTSEQIAALNYISKAPMNYETDYFERSPDEFIGMTIMLGCVEVTQIVKNSDESFEYAVEPYSDDYDESTIQFDRIYVRSESLATKYLEGDVIYLVGEYTGVEEFETVLSSAFVPTIQADTYRSGSVYYQEADAKSIAEVVFGDNVEVKTSTEHETGYTGTFNDLSNSDLQTIYMSAYSTLYTDSISNILVYNSMGETSFVLPSADFEHFYYVEGDYKWELEVLKEITYYDKDLNAVWKKEFSDGTTAYFNYTEDNLYVSTGNKLYVINNETGENVIEPVSVGITGEIYVDGDMIYITNLLSGNILTDAMVCVDIKGEVSWRADLQSNAVEVEIVYVTEEDIYVCVSTEYNDMAEVVIYDKETGVLSRSYSSMY